VTGQVFGSKLAIDIGGTFTDVVFLDRAGAISTAKVPTTPERIVEGIFHGIRNAGAAPDDVGVFVHGTTIALNALLERKSPPVGLITTGGFRDVLEIMRTNRAHMYDLMQDKPVPLVPRRLRAEVSARMTYLGEAIRELKPAEVESIAARFRDEGVASVAVCLLHAYANPRHEREIAESLRSHLRDAEITLSSDLTREWREFERTSTTVINAATKPIMTTYLGDLEQQLADRGFGGRLLIMQSNGGVTAAADARERPIASLMSGPAGAVAGAVRLARELGSATNLVTLDIGGTSADVAVIDRGDATSRTVAEIGEWPVSVPSIDIESIGAGGGSLASVDLFGALTVGPDSAGALPGPACYGRGGTRATVTDAHVVLGRIDSTQVLGGTVALDAAAAHRAVAEAVARPYAISVEQAAAGIVTVVNANMTRLLWEMVIGRGRDPRDFSLLALGGGGGLHACELAHGLGMRSVIVPPDPGAFSARGMLSADARHDFSQTIPAGSADSNPAAIDMTFSELERAALARYKRQASGDDEIELRRMFEARYDGQRGGVQVEVPSHLRGRAAIDAAVAAFEDEHDRLFGFRRSGRQVVIVRVQLSLFGMRGTTAAPHPPTPRATASTSTRPVYVDEAHHDATVLDRAALRSSFSIEGPCVIEEATGTTYVPPGWSVRTDPNLNLHIEPAGA
jgi:N-methylhydantoinase A